MPKYKDFELDMQNIETEGTVSLGSGRICWTDTPYPECTEPKPEV